MMAKARLVFLQEVPITIKLEEIFEAVLTIEKVEIVNIEQTSPGNFAIQLARDEEKLEMLSVGVIYVKEYYIIINSDGELPVSCPVCHNTLNSMVDEERNIHVLSCLGTQSQPNPEDPPSLTEESPFGVRCPYPGCGLSYEARFFPLHATKHHLDSPQNFPCPICILQGGTPYPVEKNTNLLSHLAKQHPDMISENMWDNPPFPPYFQDNIQPNMLPNPPQPNMATLFAPEQPDDYIAEISQENQTTECSICFMEYTKGDILARLPCLCLYHQKCIEDWFDKKKSRVCPLHSCK